MLTRAAATMWCGSWETWWGTLRIPGRASSGCVGCRTLAIAGNHDHAVTGKLNPDLFNGAARAAALWTADVLTDDDLAYLAGLPEVRTVDDFTHVHGSLRDPVMEYLISEPAALATFALLGTPFCLVGHSHYPIVWTEHEHGADVALLDETESLVLSFGPTGDCQSGQRGTAPGWRLAGVVPAVRQWGWRRRRDGAPSG